MKLLVKVPNNSDLLITTGQEVDFDTPLLRKQSTAAKIVPIANILKFEPEKIFINLRKLVGEQLQPGDLIAEHKTVFSTKQYYSETNGTITEINHMTGSIVIETLTEEQNMMNCFFKGEVTNIAEGRIELKVKKYKEFDIHPIKQYFGAKTFYIQPNTTPIITEEDVEDRMIIAQGIKPFEQVKLEALGAVAIAHSPEEATPTHAALLNVTLRQQADFLTALELQHPHCLIGENQNTIFFYE